MEEPRVVSEESAKTAETLPLVRIAVAEDFDAFYTRETPRLIALASALCGSAAAEDLAQDAMFAAYLRWTTISAYDNPEAWVRRVCLNNATSQLRRRAVEARGLFRLGSRRPALELPEIDLEFWAALRRLPKRQAQAAALRYIYDLSVADVARTIGISEGAAKAHLSRARTAFTRQLESVPEDTS